jgi:hypothetical protein
MVTEKTSASRIALWAAAAVLVLGLVPTAFAAKGGGSNGGGNATSPTGSLSVAPVSSTDGLSPATSLFHWGGQATYSITSTSTYGYVNLTCYQSGTLVFANNTGFHTGWPTPPVYLLSSAWTGGAATCNAVLYASNSDGSKAQRLDATSFDVAA